MENRRGEHSGRREDDDRWENIQAQLATTKQAINSLEISVDDLKDDLKTFDASLYGGLRDKDSIHSRLKQVEHTCDQLLRVVIGDGGGNGGMKKMVEGMTFQIGVLKELIEGMNESRKDRLTRWSAVGVAGVTTLGLIFTNLDKIAVGTEKFIEVFSVRRQLDANELKAQIEKMRKTRGPEIDKMLKEVERSRRGR